MVRVWRYIIWGALHGLGMVAQNVIEKLLGRQTKGLLSGIITFHLCVSWIFFRADGWQKRPTLFAVLVVSMHR